MTALPLPPPAQQERSRQTRRTLLDAGFGLLEEQGPQALTIAAISARAGVSAGTVYRRFGDKEGLLFVLQKEFTHAFRLEFTRRMAAGRTLEDTGARAAVDLGVRALCDTARAHERLLRVFIVLGLSDERVFATGQQASHEGGRAFRALLWPHRDAFTGDDPEDAIDVAYRLVYAACMHRVLHGPHLDSPTQMSWEKWADEVSRAATLSLLATV